VDFNAFADPGQHAAVVSRILQTKAPKQLEEDTRATVLVLGCAGSAEARMTCQVLRGMVMERTRQPVRVLFSLEEALEAARTASYMLVVLTAGLLNDQSFLAVLKALETSASLEIVSALADQSFEFPTATYFEELSAAGETLLVESVRRVINILALPFSPQTSIKVMNAQVDEICRRFRFEESEVSWKKPASPALQPPVAPLAHCLDPDKAQEPDEEIWEESLSWPKRETHEVALTSSWSVASFPA